MSSTRKSCRNLKVSLIIQQTVWYCSMHFALDDVVRADMQRGRLLSEFDVSATKTLQMLSALQPGFGSLHLELPRLVAHQTAERERERILASTKPLIGDVRHTHQTTRHTIGVPSTYMCAFAFRAHIGVFRSRYPSCMQIGRRVRPARALAVRAQRGVGCKMGLSPIVRLERHSSTLADEWLSLSGEDRN